MSKSTRIKIDTVIDGRDNRNILPIEEREYNLNNDDNDISGGGQPMDREYLIAQIKKHLNKKLEKFRNEPDPEKKQDLGQQSFAITLGKESLLLLLSQKDCIGVRFYFCNNPSEKDSVAAVGVRAFDKEGTNVAQDIGVRDNALSILTSNDMDKNILNFEVGPPNTVESIDNELDEERESSEPVSFDPFAIEIKQCLSDKNGKF